MHWSLLSRSTTLCWAYSCLSKFLSMMMPTVWSKKSLAWLAWKSGSGGTEKACLGTLEVQPTYPAFPGSANSKTDRQWKSQDAWRLKSAHFNFKRDTRLGAGWMVSSVKFLGLTSLRTEFSRAHIKSQMTGHPYHPVLKAQRRGSWSSLALAYPNWERGPCLRN